MGEEELDLLPEDEHQVRIPYSLEITSHTPEGMPTPRHVAEQIAADMIADGQVRMDAWELLCDCLPSGDLRREASTDYADGMCFLSGAYSQGPLHGLRRNTTTFPWVTLLICKYIRSCTTETFTSFVLQRNTMMQAHRDLNNSPASCNVVLPCSSFKGGGLWLEAPSGNCPSRDGTMLGRIQNLTLPGAIFHPHLWHETRPWQGQRITVAIYTIRAVTNLEPCHLHTMWQLEFAPLIPPPRPPPHDPTTNDAPQ